MIRHSNAFSVSSNITWKITCALNEWCSPMIARYYHQPLINVICVMLGFIWAQTKPSVFRIQLEFMDASSMQTLIYALNVTLICICPNRFAWKFSLIWFTIASITMIVLLASSVSKVFTFKVTNAWIVGCQTVCSCFHQIIARHVR